MNTKNLSRILLGSLLFTIIAVSSCSKEDNIVNEQVKQINPHRIPQGIAIKELESFLSDDDILTKSANGHRIIKSIECLTEYVPATKSGNDYNGLDTLIYIVNFDNQEGFAVLSADDRISSMIIAVTEKGELHPDDFLATQNMQEDSLIHYTDTLGIERTLNRYNAEEDDYYVARRDSSDMIPELIWDYIDGERSGRGGSDYNPGENEGGGDSGGSNSGSNQPGSNGDGSGNGWASQSVWVTRQNVPMMLQTLWNQESEAYNYNKYCPRIFGGKGVVGCIPVAVAQVMAYHGYPQGLSSGNTIIDYDTIKTVHPYGYDIGCDNPSDNAKDMLAKFLRKVGKACNAIYVGHEFTFSLSKWARRALEGYGYRNVENKWWYKKSDIINMLNSGNPVIMSAVSKVFNGHGWVIDGYRYQERVVPESGSVTGNRTLLHCNWGWDGTANGYYAYKIFNPKLGALEYEDDWEEDVLGERTEPHHYKWHFRIITYHNPNTQ